MILRRGSISDRSGLVSRGGMVPRACRRSKGRSKDFTTNRCKVIGCMISWDVAETLSALGMKPLSQLHRPLQLAHIRPHLAMVALALDHAKEALQILSCDVYLSLFTRQSNRSGLRIDCINRVVKLSFKLRVVQTTRIGLKNCH